MLTITSFGQVLSGVGDGRNIRPAAVSGTFYPADKEALSTFINRVLSETPSSTHTGDLKGLIVPHAGYIYSGKVAAHAYTLLKNKKYDTVILIGPYHKALLDGVSIWTRGAWETPLGRMTIDQESAETLFKEDPDFQLSPAYHLGEHSLEVEVPFLQTILPDAKLVPVLINQPAYSKKLAQALVKLLQNTKKSILVLISTDMSHYHPAAQALKIDHYTLDLIREKSPNLLEKALLSNKSELCGGSAVLTLLEMIKIQPNDTLEIRDYNHSGKITGSDESVVGYMAAAVYRIEPEETASYSSEEKGLLKQIAWDALKNHFKIGESQQIAMPTDPKLLEHRAVFVTLRSIKDGELRGCIGRVEAAAPLYEAVRHMAIEAATQDSRFSPVSAEELKDLSMEISILSPSHLVKSTDKIVMGKHGVSLVYKGDKKGVFLPSVALETGWSKEKFLDELCRQKSDLPEKCWRDPDAQFLLFTVEKF